MSVCEKCGWFFSGKYCPRCGTENIEESETEMSEVTLSSSVTDENREAEIRNNLWLGMHSDNINTTECIKLAKELKQYNPNDYYANFVETAINGDDNAISNFLDNSADADIEMYAESVLDYVCLHMKFGLYYSVVNYKNRSYLKDSSIYEVTIEKFIPSKVARKKKREAGFSADTDVWLHYKKLLIISTVLLCVSIISSVIFIAVNTYLAVVLPITLSLFVAALIVFASSMYLTMRYKNEIALKDEKGSDIIKR